MRRSLLESEIRRKIADKGRFLGTFYELGGSAVAECLAIGGLDFFIIDTEHGPYDVESAQTAILAAEVRGVTPFVRIKDPTRPSVLKMLDVGAKGLIVPCIHTVEEVEKLVEYAKYYPLGRRGFATTRAGGWGFSEQAASTDKYFAWANAEQLLIPQCETMGCLENIDTIAGLPGVDGIFIGPYDLSVALGKPAQMDNPELIAAIERVLAVCKEKGKLAMIYGRDAASTRYHFDQGFDCVAWGMDAVHLIAAVKGMVAAVNED